jgi:16S rRNA (guanine966-N2)-methyltransferase
MSYFIESNNSVAKILEKNCKKICKNQEYEIILNKAITALEHIFNVKPSIIFIDPPYKKENINLILIKIIERKIKINNTIIIIETGREEKVIIPTGLTVFKEKNYGKTKLLFIN